MSATAHVWLNEEEHQLETLTKKRYMKEAVPTREATIPPCNKCEILTFNENEIGPFSYEDEKSLTPLCFVRIKRYNTPNTHWKWVWCPWAIVPDDKKSIGNAVAPLLPTVNLRCAETTSCQEVNIDFGHILTKIPWNKPSQKGKIKYASYMTLKLSVSKKIDQAFISDSDSKRVKPQVERKRSEASRFNKIPLYTHG